MSSIPTIGFVTIRLSFPAQGVEAAVLSRRSGSSCAREDTRLYNVEQSPRRLRNALAQGVAALPPNYCATGDSFAVGPSRTGIFRRSRSTSALSDECPSLITHHRGFPICGLGGGLGRGRRVGRGLGVTLGVDVGLTLGEGVVVGVAVAVAEGVGVVVGFGVGVTGGVAVGVGVALPVPLNATVTPAQGPTPCCTQHEVNVKFT